MRTKRAIDNSYGIAKYFSQFGQRIGSCVRGGASFRFTNFFCHDDVYFG